MGREVRMVPPDWQHPCDEQGKYIALLGGSFAEAAKGWDEECAKWNRGEYPSYASEENKKLTYAEWNGERPRAEDYMPDFALGSETHFMMYENTSEGTPISPAFATPEELARWLADTGASAFADQTASYESWLRVAKGGFACSAVITNGVLTSGVEAG